MVEVLEFSVDMECGSRALCKKMKKAERRKGRAMRAGGLVWPLKAFCLLALVFIKLICFFLSPFHRILHAAI